VIVLANFGVSPAIEEASVIPSEAKESVDNRPAGETGGTPFLNLEADPVTVTVNLDGAYTEIFTGEVFKKGMHDFVLKPGDYLVFTK
jgi:hypothetical protein